MAGRHPILTMVLVALVAWLCLGLFGKFVAPESAGARLVFLLLLLMALTATFTPAAQLIGSRLVRSKTYAQHRLRHAFRQGGLLALAIVANLTLKALDAWSWADVILIALAVALIELIALARK
jgi:hypothetical protein